MTSIFLLGLLAVLMLYALLAGADASLQTLNRLRLHHFARNGDARAEALERLLRPPHRVHEAVRFASALARCLVLLGVARWAFLGSGGQRALFAASSLLLLTLADAVARPWCSVRPIDRLGRIVPVVKVLERIFRPFTHLRLLPAVPRGQPPGSSAAEPVMSREMLSRLLQDGVKTGTLSGREHAMISRVFELQTRLVTDIMVPFSRMVFVHSDTPLQSFYEKCRQTGLIRMPVLDSTTGTFSGIINVFYLVGQLTGETHSVGEYMRPPLFVPAGLSIVELLSRMRLNRQPMALVRRSDGVVLGLTTIDDVLEAIVTETA